MSEENLSKYKTHPSYEFWLKLKPGYDRFENLKAPPEIYACNDQYGFADDKGNRPKGCAPLRAW